MFRLQQALSGRRKGDEAALETLRGVDRRAVRRGARPQVCRAILPSRREGARAGAGEERAARDEGYDRWAAMDGSGDKAEGAGEARHFQSQDWISTQMGG